MFAERKGWCQDGYAKVQKLDLLLRSSRWRRQGPRLHHAELPVAAVPAFMAELREVSGVMARCLEVDILTASRVNSVVNMRWEDVDLKAGIWRCPKEFMKISNNGDHIVYLAPQVQQIIASMPRILPGGRKAVWVFSTEQGEHVSNALTKPIQSINS